MMQSINPATGDLIAEFDLHTDAEVDAILAGASKAQRAWRRVSVGERMTLLTAMARELRAGKERFARLITAEIGKPITESLGEVEKCAVTCASAWTVATASDQQAIHAASHCRLPTAFRGCEAKYDASSVRGGGELPFRAA